MKVTNKKKLWLLTAITSLVVCLSVCIGYTISWFDDTATSRAVSPTSLKTNGLQTDALVYSGNGAHTNDDATGQTATPDEGGSYGYDHSQNGKATSYYLMLDRDNNGSVSLTSGDSLQMFTNIYNSADEACYFKLTLKEGDIFKIYNSDLSGSLAESWFGYDRIQSGCIDSYNTRFGALSWPFEDDNGGDHNIRIKTGAATEAYDIYFDDYSGIWIDKHVDETRSKVTSTSTGYYIIGSSDNSDSGAFSLPWSIEGGHAMYIDTANGTNKGVYQGLYLEPNDIFKISTKSDATGEWHGYTNLYNSCGAYSCFTNDADDNIKCLVTGYYNIYVTTAANTNVSIERYAGTYSAGGGSHTAKGKINPNRYNVATFDDTKLNYVQLQFKLSDSNNSDRADTYEGAYYYLQLTGGATNTGAPGIQMFNCPGSEKISAIVDASEYVGWTKVQVHRCSSTGEIWQSTAEKTVSANTKNFFKVTYGGGGEHIWWRDEGSEERFSRVNEYYVKDGGSPTLEQDTGACWNDDGYTPVAGANPSVAGYTFNGWYTNSACTSSWTSGSKITHDRNLYAKFTINTSHYDLEGQFSGSNDWVVHANATRVTKTGTNALSGTVSFDGISFAKDDEWKIHRTNYSVAWWGYNSGLSSYAHGTDGNNIIMDVAGTYNVSLDLSSGIISLSPVQYKLYQYASTGGSAVQGFPITQSLNDSGIAIFNNVTLTVGKYWHIESVATADDSWGWNTDNDATDHIQATTNYASYFEKGDGQKGSQNKVWNIKNRYTITAKITFNKNANTIVVDIANATFSNIFSFKESNAVGGTTYSTTKGTTSVSGTIVTVSNAVLQTGYNYYLHVNGGTGFGWNTFYVNSAYPTMTYATSTSITSQSSYFYTSNNNIGVSYGGQYDFTIDLATGKFSAIHLDSLTSTDFKLKVDGSDTAFSSQDGYVWTKSSLHLDIGSTIYVQNDNSTSTRSFTSGNGLTINTGSYSKYFATDTNGYLKSLVDCAVTVTFTFAPSTATGTLAVTSFSKNDATIQDYKNSQVESGLYFVNSVSDYSCGGAGAVRMFYGTQENTGCVYAYSGLVVNNANTKYKLREAYNTDDKHLYEHLSAQTLLEFSNNGTDFGTSAGKDDGVYVKFTQNGTYDILIYEETIQGNTEFTIEAKFTGKTVNTSTEHEGKWRLIGKGTAPASALYDCDFTTNRSLPMYCAQGVAEPYPCYAGAKGTTAGDTGSPAKGNAIVLLEGDKLALNTNNSLMAPTINATYGSTSSNIVTIKRSGYYFVYATNSAFTIEFSSKYDDRNGTDYGLESSENSNPYGSPASYTKLEGARVKNASGNTLSFAAGINTSILDAEGGYIKIFVELRHINKSGKSGSLTAALSNINAPAGTKYTVKTYSNDNESPVQSAINNLNSLSGSTKINNQSFANGTMYSDQAIASLNSDCFSVATIIEIDIPLSAITLNTHTNSVGNTYTTYDLYFDITLSYSEA